MHALNALPAALVEPALLGDVPPGVVDGADPHAARAKAATETTAAIFTDVRTRSPILKCTKSREMHQMAQFFVTLPATIMNVCRAGTHYPY
jgi:hypothetical protein